MKIKLSPAMEKVIEEVKTYAIWLNAEKDNTISKLEKQATKHKKLTFVFKIKGSPDFMLYVNKDLYGIYLYDGLKWKLEGV